MRRVKFSAPQGKGKAVAEVCFSVGVENLTIKESEVYHADGKKETKDVVDVETSTPRAKRCVDAVLAADFFDLKEYSIVVRGARSIISDTSVRELTVPLQEPASDILEELWLFNHITSSFVGRFFIAACLLAYGLIQSQLLLIIAGLLFLPVLPLLMAIGFGGWTSNWKLSVQGVKAFLTGIILLYLGGVLIALMAKPPIKWDDFSSLFVGFLISLGVGVAAGLAQIDDGGKRELIGLAATAQITIVPVWFGICTIFGFPATVSKSFITERALSLVINVATIIITSLIVYILTGAATRSLSRVKE
ncbi:MAG TPA: hypothetical protein VGC76_12685 [Pyrinomonadaceae bacterium]|jgi:hypothetical protein